MVLMIMMGMWMIICFDNHDKTILDPKLYYVRENMFSMIFARYDHSHDWG